MIEFLASFALAADSLTNAPIPAAPDDSIKIVMECPLIGNDGVKHKILLGFDQDYISKVDPRSARVLDPDRILAGAALASVRIDEAMVPGSTYAVAFRRDRNVRLRLSLLTIETGAFNATLEPERGHRGPSYAGRCFMIDGPIATYVFKRRVQGQWGAQ